MPLSASPTHSARSTDSTDCSAASRSSPVRAMSSSWRGGRAAVDWETPPSRVLVAATPHSAKATAALPVVCNFLRERCTIQPLVEEKLRRIAGDGVETLRLVDGKVVDPIDFVICLGGDGLILHVVSTLFPAEVPPIMPFNMGSMGFLTPFDFADHAQEIPRIIKGNYVPVAVRMRLRCAVIRKASTADADDAPNGVQGCFHNFEDNMLLEEDVRGAVGAEYHVLNELVIDRGPAPYLSNLEVLCDNCPVTRVQADGLIVATPTGSTAYSLSSGGSMVHPGVPAILFTPICPHSLSFRPVLFPDYVTLQIKVPEDARASAWVSFDGRHRMELMRGDHVVVTVSPWSVPTFSKTDATTDWFRSVSTCLRWNERVTQESMEQSDVA